MKVYIVRILNEMVVNTKKIFADEVIIREGTISFLINNEIQFICPVAISLVKTDNMKRSITPDAAKIANYLTVLN
jgi:hypothetical protein